MKKEYENIVKDICQVNNWRKPYTVSPSMTRGEKAEIFVASLAEKEGAIGVACVLAHMQGCPTEIDAMSRTIGVPVEEIEEPFKRLIVNGIFSSSYNVKDDSVLTGNCGDTEDGWMTGAERTRNAWGIIAGIAGGLTGLREEIQEQ